MRLETPYGDVNAPHHAETLTKLLQDVAAQQSTLVTMPAEDCYDDLRTCAVAAGKRAGAGIVIYGMLVHGTEAGSADIRLESVAIPSEVVRTWEDSIVNSEQFYEGAVHSAYAALVVAPSP